MMIDYSDNNACLQSQSVYALILPYFVWRHMLTNSLLSHITHLDRWLINPSELTSKTLLSVRIRDTGDDESAKGKQVSPL